MKRIFAFLAVLIVLFAFLVIPVSASSIITYSGPDFQDVPSMSCPVPIDIYFDVTRGDQGEGGVTAYTYYGLSASLSSIVYLNQFSSSNYNSVRDLLPSDFKWTGFAVPVSSTLELFDSDPDRNDDFAFIGTCSFNYNGFKFSNTQDSGSLSYPSFLVTDTDVKLSLRDFYMWNQTFDNSITTNSEISLIFDYITSALRPYYFDFYYSLAGDSTINYLSVPASDFDSSENSNVGSFVFSPSVLDIDDREAVVYVHQCLIRMGDSPYALGDSLLSEVIFALTATYTFNPYLDNYSTVPVEPDVPVPPVDPDNPAIALSRYTEWIGDALGGFLDFNIFPGFTLGGIFMTLLAFSCVVWFLKLVAGG